MRTARALTVSPSMLCGGKEGGVCSRGDVGVCSWGGGCLLRGCLLLGGVSALGGVCLLWGVVSAPGGVVSALGGICSRGASGLGVSAPGGVCSGGVCSRGVCSQGAVSAPGGVYLVLGGVHGQVLPPVDRHTPVNILPCPKLRLRAVKIAMGIFDDINASQVEQYVSIVTCYQNYLNNIFERLSGYFPV